MNRLVTERELGQLPLSIGTSLGIESAFGVHPEIQVDSAPILEYQELWINIRTLFRNFIGALEKDAISRVDPGDIGEGIMQEMEVIADQVASVSKNGCRVVFYASNYDSVGKGLKQAHAVPKKDNTEKQKLYTIVLKKAIQYIYDHMRHAVNLPFKVALFASKLSQPGDARNHVLIMTNYAYDLLSAKSFGSLTLLESHTGKIKKPPLWYTKYTGGKELAMMPFREDLLQVFGDSEHYRPMDIKLRKDLIEVATKYHWVWNTTPDKIRYGIQQIKNPYFREILLSMLV